MAVVVRVNGIGAFYTRTTAALRRPSHERERRAGGIASTHPGAWNVSSANAVHLVLAPADVAWKSCALRTVFCDPRWVPNPTRQSR